MAEFKMRAQDPPGEKSGRGTVVLPDALAFARKLKGKWAMIAEYVNPAAGRSTAHRWSRDKRAAGFEFTTRYEEGVCRVYCRHVGTNGDRP